MLAGDGNAGVRVGVGVFVFVGEDLDPVGAVAPVDVGVFELFGGEGVLLALNKVAVTLGNSIGCTFAFGGALVAEFANVGVARLLLNGAKASEQQQHVNANISKAPQPPIVHARRGPPTRLLNETKKS